MKRAQADSLEGRVSRSAFAWVLAALIATGVGTAALLHRRSVAELDRLLLVAAQAGGPPLTWTNGHFPGPVVVRDWTPGDLEVDVDDVHLAYMTEAPVYRDAGHRRLLLLAVEPRGTPSVDVEGAHPHALRVASADREGPLVTVGAFATLYAAVSVAVASAVGVVLPRRVRVALAPLETTRRALEALTGLAVRSRLLGGGPREVADLVASVNALLERLDAAVSAQGRFTAEAAHELRTPVATLRAELELALRRPRSAEDYQAALRGALLSVDRLGALVEGLMALARVDAGQIEESMGPERLSTVISAAVAAEQPTIGAAGGQLRLQLGADPELPLHVALLTAAVANLLRNAAVHAPGAAVALSVVTEGAEVLVHVDDAGPGLPAAARDSVLAAFAREGRARGGLGLGLTLSQEVARRHGGGLRLDPSPLGGLRATLRLPLREAALQAASKGAPSEG